MTNNHNAEPDMVRVLRAYGHDVPSARANAETHLFRGALPHQIAALTSAADETLLTGTGRAGKTWTCRAFIGALADRETTRAAVILCNEYMYRENYENTPIARRMVHHAGAWHSRNGATVTFFDASAARFADEIADAEFTHVVVDNADLVARAFAGRTAATDTVLQIIGRSTRTLATANELIGPIATRFARTLRDARSRTVIAAPPMLPAALSESYVETLSGDLAPTPG
jgi:hypothetical protein